MLTTLVLVVLAMLAFAANSLFGRAALVEPSIDPAAYTIVRLCSGALMLAILMIAQQGRSFMQRRPGTWLSALALFAYAIAFSYAYLRLGAAIGTLILFGAVQCSMLFWGVFRRDHPSALELVGLVVAFAALIYLLSPGVTQPDLLGSLLMTLSGIAWGVYSLRGQGSAHSLTDTTGNFIRCVPLCIPLLVLPGTGGTMTGYGIALALASGAISSAIGYAIWYRALPGLSTTQAAVVQLTVPVIAALGAVAMLGETLTLRLVVSAIFVIGGVALAILSRRPGAIRSNGGR